MHRCKKNKLAELRSMLTDAGYELIFTHRTRTELVAILTIAVNQIAAGTGRSVWHVHDAIGRTFRYLRRGVHFGPGHIRPIRAGRQLDGGRGGECRDDDGTVCPCCGRPLPDDLPKTIRFDPLDPQHSPQSGGCERE